MATNKLQSPSASLANTLKAPVLPNIYDTEKEFDNKKEDLFSGFKAKPIPTPIPTPTTGVGTTSVDVDIKRAKEDKETISTLAKSSSMEARIAQGEGLFDFTPTKRELTIDKPIDIDSLGNLKLSVYDAQKRIDDFNNPNSAIANAFKANLGDKRYEFTKLVDDVKKKSLSRSNLEASQGEFNKTITDAAEATTEQGITGIISTVTTKSLDYAFGQSQYKTNKYAKEYNLETGKESSSPIAEGGASFGVNAPFYIAMGGISGGASLARIAGFGLNTVKGKTGLEIARFASRLENVSMAHPTLYAATVDNALTTAVEYTGRAAAGMDTSGAISDLMFGAALPIGFKGVGKAWDGWNKVFGDITPKDLKRLEKATFDEVEASVDKSPSSAINILGDKFFFENGTSLSENVANAKKYWGDKRAKTTTITPEEVIADFSKKGITTTKAGGLMISEAINRLNQGIKGVDEMGQGYGDIGAEGKSILTKQAIINEVTESGIANEANVTKAIDNAKKSNGVELEVSKNDLTEEEQFEELLSNKDNKIENLLDAKDANDVKLSIEGSKKKATKDGLDGLRFANDTGELKLDDLQSIADEVGVKVNTDKLYKTQSVLETKEKVIDTEYVNKLIDEIELKRTGYSSTKSSFLSEFKSKVSTTYKNITDKVDDVFSSKKEVDKGIKAELDNLKKEGDELATRIKNITKANEGAKIQKLIDDNRAKIVELKKSAIYKDKIKTNFIKDIKDSIDMAGTNYTRSYFRRPSTQSQINKAALDEARGKTPKEVRLTPSYTTETILDSKTIATIKNKYKALINPTTTVKRATELMQKMDEELHKLSFEKMEKDADDLMKRVLSKTKNKKAKANIDIESIMKVADTYIKIQKAGGDLDRVRDLIVDLERFEREGKDLFKVNQKIKKSDIRAIAQEGANVLDSEGKTRFELRGRNSPTSGEGTNLGVVGNTIDWLSESVSAALNIPRIFGNAKGLTKVFLGNFQRAQGAFNNIRREVVDIHGVGALREANSIVKTNEGDASYKLTMWMRRNTEFGEETNMMSNVTFQKNAKGQYDVLFIKNTDAHFKVNKDRYDKGDFIFFGNQGNDDLKKKILSNIYRKFDEGIKYNSKFKKEIDWVNSHFSTNADDIIEIGKGTFNKIDFHKQEQYFPSAKRGKGGDESSIDSDGRYDDDMRQSIQNGFLKKKTPPSLRDMQEMEMGFIENLDYHTNTAVWWKLNIENLMEADATLRQLRKGHKGLGEEPELNTELLFDTSIFGKTVKDAGTSNLENPLISKEVDRYLSAHLEKIATRGRSLSNNDAADKFIKKLVGYANQIILGTPEVAIKQLLGYPVIALHTGTKNMASGMKNSNGANLDFARNTSGMLMERQATYVSKEGDAYFHYVTQSDEWTAMFGKIGRGYGRGLEHIIGNTTKFVDGALSSRAWMSGMSKYLDEQGIVKSGEKFDLETISKQLGDEQWKEAVDYADNIMGRIVGSNSVTDKATLANSILTRTTMLFMRTGLHQMVSAFDTIADVANSSKFRGDSKTKMRLLEVAQGGKIFLTSIVIAIMNETINEGRTRTKINMGVKDKNEQFATRDVITGQVIEDPTLEQIVLDITQRYISSVTINPKFSPDLFTGFSPMRKGLSEAISAPTIERKMEELSYAITKGFVPSTYADMMRYGISKLGIGSTPVDAKLYDAAVNTIKKQYDDKWGSLDNNKRDELISIQLQKNELNKEESDLNKPKQESEDKFIKESLNKYGKDITFKQFIDSFNDADDKAFFKGKSVNDLENIYNKVKLSGAKKSGERDSILMGLNASEIFKLELQPMIDNGKMKEAFNRWKEMYKEDGTGVFKSVKGYNQVGEMMVIYQNKK